MNETGEIMPAPDTSAEVKGNNIVIDTKPASIADVKPAGYDTPEGPVDADALSRSTVVNKATELTEEKTSEDTDEKPKETLGKEPDDKKVDNKDHKEKEPKEKKAETDEEDEVDKKVKERLEKAEAEDADKPDVVLEKELQELLREYSGEIDDQDQEGLAGNELQSDNVKGGKKKERTMTVDMKAELRRMLAIIWKIIKRMLFKGLMGPDEQKQKMSGKEFGIEETPFEGEENENEAIRQGLKQKRHKDTVAAFNEEQGSEEELGEAAKRHFNETLYKIKTDDEEMDVPQLFQSRKNRTDFLQGRMTSIRKQLATRAAARLKAA